MLNILILVHQGTENEGNQRGMEERERRRGREGNEQERGEKGERKRGTCNRGIREVEFIDSGSEKGGPLILLLFIFKIEQYGLLFHYKFQCVIFAVFLKGCEC